MFYMSSISGPGDNASIHSHSRLLTDAFPNRMELVGLTQANTWQPEGFWENRSHYKNRWEKWLITHTHTHTPAQTGSWDSSYLTQGISQLQTWTLTASASKHGGLPDHFPTRDSEKQLSLQATSPSHHKLHCWSDSPRLSLSNWLRTQSENCRYSMSLR